MGNVDVSHLQGPGYDLELRSLWSFTCSCHVPVGDLLELSGEKKQKKQQHADRHGLDYAKLPLGVNEK